MSDRLVLVRVTDPEVDTVRAYQGRTLSDGSQVVPKLSQGSLIEGVGRSLGQTCDEIERLLGGRGQLLGIVGHGSFSVV